MWLAACTADYDTFGTSDYNNFNDISFEEQTEDVSIDADAHVITVRLAAPDSGKKLDSITVSGLKLSHLASLYIVESKFKEFPKDSAALDSLAREVAYSDSKIKTDSKVYLPASRILYLLVVSESGEPSIWKMVFTVGDEEPPAEENPGQGPSSESSTESSSAALISSSSVVILSSENHLSLKFANVLKQNVVEDTIFIRLKSDQTLETAALESFEISGGASISPKPDEVKGWSENQKFVVTAEDGTERKWRLNLAIADPDEVASSDKELISISAEGEVKAATIDAKTNTVTLHMNSRTAALQAKVSAEISPTASMNISKGATLDLTKKQNLVITAEDVSSDTWTLTADYYPEPRILSMKVGGKAATVDSVIENGAYFRWVHADNMDFLSDLTSLSVSDIELTEGASAQVVSTKAALSAGTKYNLGYGLLVSVSNGGESQEYEIRAGYQYPNSDFGAWITGPDGYAQLDGWDNGNNQYTKTLAQKSTDGTRIVNKMVSVDVDAVIFKTFASGNSFIADFNPKGVSAISMAGYPDGNELIDFGKSFAGRPRFIEFDAKYSGSGDSCDLYIILENRSAGVDAKNVDRSTSKSVNTLIASAWYRATTITDKPNRPVPDLVSVNDIGGGYSTIRLKLQYGEPSAGSPIFNSRVLSTVAKELKKKEGIDNRVDPISAAKADSLDVTHIRIVTASSAAGNLYIGKKGATLYVDEIRLIY